jgi:hypothetical protein
MPPQKSRSGPNIDEAQRHTTRINVRLPDVLAKSIESDCETYDLTIGQALAAYRDLAVASGRLPKALFAAGAREEKPLEYEAAVRPVEPETRAPKKPH